MPKRDEKYMADRRDEIIDATLACLIRSGLPALSTTAICEEAGISMGALYTHFATKDEILVALAVRSEQRRREKLDFAGAAALRNFYLDISESVTSKSAREGFRVDMELMGAASRDERIAKALQPFRDSRDLVDVIKRLKASGEIRKEVDPEAAATALDAMLYGARMLAFVGGRPPKAYRQAMALLLDRIA